MSRGDCFFCLGRYWALSLLLHAVILLSHDFELSPMQRKPELRTRVSLRAPLPQLADTSHTPLARERVKKAPAISGRPKTASSSRSTAVLSKNRLSGSATTPGSVVAESSTLDEMDVALYRLALARNASRLLALRGQETREAGEMAFEMVKQEGGAPSSVRLYSSTVTKVLNEEMLMLMQLAVSQTPIPSAWEGRQVRIPLRLQLELESAQREEKSGCSSCS